MASSDDDSERAVFDFFLELDDFRDDSSSLSELESASLSLLEASSLESLSLSESSRLGFFADFFVVDAAEDLLDDDAERCGSSRFLVAVDDFFDDDDDDGIVIVEMSYAVVYRLVVYVSVCKYSISLFS